MHFSFQRFLYNVNLLGTHSKIEELKKFSVDNLGKLLMEFNKPIVLDPRI